MSYESLGYLDEQHLPHLKKGEWPAWSPDLSPIENVWQAMLSRMSKYPKKGNLSEEEKKKELIAHVWKSWNSISQTEINKYVASAAERLRECVQLRGEWTNH